MIDIIAQAADQATELTQQVTGISGSIQGGLGCLGAAIGVGIVGM
jgi:F0F1-type ATP synthase membrane subunit c/vacuolar-type H+-ATPase subunit K